MRRQMFVSSLLLGLAVSVHAADATLDAGRRCAQVQDSLERLVCYDRLFAPAAAAAAEPPVARPAAPAREMGVEQVRRPEAERDAEQVNSLQARVSAVTQTRPQLYRVTLDNGQVWQQQEVDGRFQLKEGDTVQIDRGRLGGYRMSRISGGRSSWVTVSRTQ